jgi:hypothetical protein
MQELVMSSDFASWYKSGAGNVVRDRSSAT